MLLEGEYKMVYIIIHVSMQLYYITRTHCVYFYRVFKKDENYHISLAIQKKIEVFM